MGFREFREFRGFRGLGFRQQQGVMDTNNIGFMGVLALDTLLLELYWGYIGVLLVLYWHNGVIGFYP